MEGEQLDMFKQERRPQNEKNSAENFSKSEEQDFEYQQKIKEILDKSIADLTLKDFVEFNDDLKKYEQRFRSFQQQYYHQKLDPNSREALYKKLVFPQTYDEPEYRSLAALYLKFKQVEKKFRQDFQDSKANIKNDSLKNEVFDEQDDDFPDPYGDIYPYSRELRRKKPK